MRRSAVPAPPSAKPSGKSCPYCDSPGLPADARDCPHCHRNLISGLPTRSAPAAEGGEEAGPRTFIRKNLKLVIGLGVVLTVLAFYFVLLWPVRSEAAAVAEELEEKHGLKDVQLEIPSFAMSMPEKVRVTATCKFYKGQLLQGKSLAGPGEGWYYPKERKVVIRASVGETGANYLNPNQAVGRIKLTIHLGKKTE